MYSLSRYLVWVLAVACSTASSSWAQYAVFAGVPASSPVKALTPSGELPVRFQALERTPDLLVVLATDCLLAEDYDSARRLIGSATPVRFALFRTGVPLEIAGPFRSRAEVQASLRKLRPPADSVACQPAADFFTALAGALATEPSEWGITVVIGRIPPFDSGADPAIPKYTAAWMIRECIARKRSLLFEDPSGQQSPLTDAVSRSTGAPALADLSSPGPLTAIEWDPFPLSHGFDLQAVALEGSMGSVPVIAAAPDAVIPSIGKFVELRAAIAAAQPDPALKINPADRDAVMLSIKIAAREKNAAAEIQLLETAVELNPVETGLWSRLGDLRFNEKNYPAAERALLRARELGASGARASEQLGRIALDHKDPARALDFLNDSLGLDAGQQPLWFFTADIAKQLNRTDRQIECLEHGLALGGSQIPRRAELIGIYLAKGDSARAAFHADFELPHLPADAETQTLWARFYEQLARPDEALKCWKQVVAVAPRTEPAHYAISTILLTRKLYPDALEAANHGLEADAKSGRLELVKIDSLENLERIYEARRSLDAFAPGSTDIGVLKRHAEFTDRFGGDAPAAWKRYAEVLSTSPATQAELARVFERGAVVAAREGDAPVRFWFEDRLTGLRNPGSLAVASLNNAAKPAQTSSVWIPGGIDALSFIVGGRPGIPPDRFLIDYCRRIIARAQDNNQELAFMQKEVAGYFDQLRQLVAISTMNGNHATLTLSLTGKPAQERTERALSLFGWKLSRSKQKFLVQSGEKKTQTRNQDLASALAIDQGGMQVAFDKGAPFQIEIPFDSVPVLFEEATWRVPARADKLAGGLAEALVENPDYARVYLGLSNVDKATAAVLLSAFGFNERYAELLAAYSSALAVVGGRAAVPGGTAAEPLWAKLAGISPADPARFFRALLDKDQGHLLSWFFQLSELDEAHQRFFTSSQHRIDAFYEAFSHSQDAGVRPGRLTRANSFSDFLRSIPLEGNNVDFPGSPQVWMVATGRTVTAEQSGKLMRKVRKVATPDVEDQILLRLARIHDKAENGAASETTAFLAVARIDEHRAEPLEEQSALLLAQNYNEFQSLYPYFAEFRSLTAADFQSFFNVVSRIKALDQIQAELVLGQFEALIELLRIATANGAIADARATEIFRMACAAFANAPDLAGYTTASLDASRELLRAKTGAKDADGALAEILLRTAPQVEIEWNDSVIVIDTTRRRKVAYGRVLNLQKVPEFALLLRMDDTVRRIAAANQAPAPLADALARDADAVPAAEIPKTFRIQGKARQSILRFSPLKLRQVAAELRQAAQKKKVNQKDLQKLARDFLEEMAPQVRLALAGVVYAVNLDPTDILVENDPLLVRKHQSFDLSSSSSGKQRFPTGGLLEASEGEGSYFTGSFAQFALAAAHARGSTRSEASSALLVNQFASIRLTPWSLYKDSDQRMLGMKLRMAREWCVYAATDPAAFAALSEDTLGLLSLTRRRQLLDAVSAHRWKEIADPLTLSDLLVLADRYLARYPKALWQSPVDTDLRRAVSSLGDSGTATLDLLGSVPASLYGCGHPHLVTLAPYEEYEHHLFPVEMAERAAEMKLYLAAAMDRSSIPAAAMAAIAEEVAKRAFGSMRMSDERDWTSALKAFSAIDERMIGAAIGALGNQ